MPISRAAFARFEAYGLDNILERVADGETLRSLAADPQLATSRPMLNNWLLGAMGNEDPATEEGKRIRRERRAAYELAKRSSADVLVEDAGEILDAESDPKAAALVKAKSDFRLWLAARRNRDSYGQQQNPALVINVGSLHLDALRKVMAAAPALPAPRAELPPGDAEHVIEGEVDA